MTPTSVRHTGSTIVREIGLVSETDMLLSTKCPCYQREAESEL